MSLVKSLHKKRQSSLGGRGGERRWGFFGEITGFRQRSGQDRSSKELERRVWKGFCWIELHASPETHHKEFYEIFTTGIFFEATKFKSRLTLNYFGCGNANEGKVSFIILHLFGKRTTTLTVSGLGRNLKMFEVC